MKRKIAALLLSFLLAFGCCPQELLTAQAAQTAEETDTEDVAETTPSDEDVPIETTDVPYQVIEWCDDEAPTAKVQENTGKVVYEREHEIVLVLDVSGSMYGDPITELKKACSNFVDDILNEDENAGIAIVTYDDNVTAYQFSGEYFSNDRDALKEVINALDDGGSTAMNAGLAKADEILYQYGKAEDQFIIQMADGIPNEGNGYYGSDARYNKGTYTDLEGNTFSYSNQSYASEVYNTFASIESGYKIYSLGFLHRISGAQKQFASVFLNDIQNQGYHEVIDADLLSFSFETIAQDINSDNLILDKTSLALAKGMSDQVKLSFADSFNPDTDSIKWGTSDTRIVQVSGDGTTATITGLREGTCTIVAEAGGFHVTCSVTVGKEADKGEEVTLTVYEQEEKTLNTLTLQSILDLLKPTYIVSENATVTYNGTSYTTGSDGRVTIPNVNEGEIAVSKDGFISKTLDADSVSSSATVRLKKESENPVINSVTVNGSDVLEDTVEISSTEQSPTTFSVDVEWGKGGAGSIQLVQEATAITFDQTSFSIVLANRFDLDKEIYIIVTNGAGNSSKEELLLESSTSIKGLSDASISLGKSISLSIPSGVPLVGGTPITLDASLKTLPINVSIDDGGKVTATIGVDMVSYTQTTYNYTNKQTGKEVNKKKKAEIKTLADNVKDIFKDSEKGKTTSASQKWAKMKQKYKNAIKRTGGSFTVDADFSVIGYLEGYIDDNGEFSMLNGGIILNPSASASWSGQFAIGPIPMYWEAAIKGEIEAQLNLYRSASAQYQPTGSIGGSLSGSVGAGIGVNKVATVGGGGTLTLSPKATFYNNGNETYLEMTTKLQAYFKVKIVCIEYTWEPEGLSKEWKINNGIVQDEDEDENGNGGNVWEVDTSEDGTTASVSSIDEEDIYDIDSYSMEDLSYLEEKADTESAGATAKTYSSETTAVVETLSENCYSTTSPKIVSLKGNTKLAVWVDADEADYDKIQLHYSYYDGAGWSTPKVVDEDGTADFSPEVCVLNNKAYIIWQDANGSIAADADAEALAKMMDITAAEYNPATDTFTVTALTNDAEGEGTLDMMPSISASDGTVAAAWVTNAENEWFGNNAVNTVYTRTLQDGTWSDAQTAAANLSKIRSLAVDVNNGQVQTAYTLEESEENHELYLNGKQVTDNEVVDSSPCFSNHALYWYSDGTIQCMEDLTTFASESILPEDVTLETDQFKLVEQGSKRAILYTVSDGLYNEICGMYYDSETKTWGKPLTLTDEGAYIQDFSAVWGDEGLEVLAQKTAVTGSLEEQEEDTDLSATEYYGTSSLVLMNLAPETAVRLDTCVYDEADILVGGVLPFSLTVTNTSAEAIDGVTVTVTDEEGNVEDSVVFTQDIASGDAADISYKYLVKQEDIGKTYTLTVTPKGVADADTSASTSEITFAYDDIAVEDLHTGNRAGGKSTLVLGQIANNGFTDAKEIKVSLYKDNTDGTPVETMTLDELAAGDRANVTFEVSYEDNAIYYVVAESSLEEYNSANNSDYVCLGVLSTEEGRTAQSITVSKTKTAYTAGETLSLGDLTVKANYDDGTVSNVNDYAVIDASAVNMSVDGTYPIYVTVGTLTGSVSITVTGNTPASGNGTSGTGASGSGTDSSAISDISPENCVTGVQTTVGNVVTVGTMKYKILKSEAASGEVSFVGVTSAVSKLTIPEKIGLNGVPYTITQIGNNALKNNKKLKSVVIPKGVKKIGAQAFSGCKSLKKITVKTTTLKSVGKKAFKNINAKATFKVPKAKLAAYKKKLFKKSVGYRKGWKIKK